MGVGPEEKNHEQEVHGSAWKRFSSEINAKQHSIEKPLINHQDSRIPFGLGLAATLIVGILLGRATIVGAKELVPVTSEGVAMKQSFLTQGRGINTGLRFDPYFEGYVREVGFQFQPMQNIYESYVLHPSVTVPPPGVTVRIVRPDLMGRFRTITGGPGIPTGDRREQLANSIRSLMKFEESQMAIDGTIPTTSYDKAPWQPVISGYEGQPVVVGWHDIEVETLAGKWRFLLPDHRYVNGREAAFQTCLKQRLYYHIDQKVFSDIGPYGSEFPKDSVDFSSKVELPSGVSVAMHDDKIAYYARGPKFDPNMVSDDLEFELIKLKLAIQKLFEEVAKLPKFSEMSGEKAKDFRFSVRVVFPMGEHQYWCSVAMIRNPGSKELEYPLKSWCYAVGYALSGLRTGSSMVMRYKSPNEISYEGVTRESDQKVLANYRP